MKRTIGIFAVAVALMLLCLSAAQANSLKQIEVVADCEGFTITVTGVTYKSLVSHVAYDLMLLRAGQEGTPILVSGTFDVPAGHFDGYQDTPPVVFQGVWPTVLCGTYTTEAQLTLISYYNGELYSELPYSAEGPLVDCPCDDQWCPRTPGYWKNHPESWPVLELQIGDTIYSQDELLVMLWVPVRGNVSVILIKHLIAAKLNLLAGADGASVANVIIQADMLLADGDGSRPTLRDLKDQLDAFNNGACD